MENIAKTLNETQITRFFFVQEMSHFLQQYGLSPLKWFSDFRDDDKINSETWKIVTVARREGKSK